MMIDPPLQILFVSAADPAAFVRGDHAMKLKQKRILSGLVTEKLMIA